MTVQDIIQEIIKKAPLNYQENYDNSGLQLGNPNAEVTSALLTLDVTEATVEEAIQLGSNLIISHHPLLFKPIKNLIGKNYIERVVIKAIQNNISIFSAHTNLDNMRDGVNQKIGEKLGLENLKILAPLKNNIVKLHFYVPEQDADRVTDKLFEAGAGEIGNYTEASFQMSGTGTFKPGANTHPAIGQTNGPRELVQERKVEVIFPEEKKGTILKALFQNHPYEEVAYGLTRLENQDQTKGAGMVGELPNPVSPLKFLEKIKTAMQAACVRHTALCKEKIQKVAYCGGSGSFLLKDAIRAGADLFLTADFKYHQFFDAENKIIIADIGHYESEQYTIEIFSQILKEKFPNFATHLTKVNTNPVNYYF